MSCRKTSNGEDNLTQSIQPAMRNKRKTEPSIPRNDLMS